MYRSNCHLEDHYGAVSRVELSHLCDICGLWEGTCQCWQESVVEAIMSLWLPREIEMSSSYRSSMRSTPAESSTTAFFLNWLRCSPECTSDTCCCPSCSCQSSTGYAADKWETLWWHTVDPHDPARRSGLRWRHCSPLTQPSRHAIQGNGACKYLSEDRP